MFDFVFAVWDDFWVQSPVEKTGFLLAIMGVSAVSFFPTRFRLGKTKAAIAGLEARNEQLKADLEKEIRRRERTEREIGKNSPSTILSIYNKEKTNNNLSRSINILENYETDEKYARGELEFRKACLLSAKIIGTSPEKSIQKARKSAYRAHYSCKSHDQSGRLANELHRLENEIIYEFPTTLPDDYLCAGYDSIIAFQSIAEIVYELNTKGIPFVLSLFCERAFSILDQSHFDPTHERLELFDVYLSFLVQSGQDHRSLDLAEKEIQRLNNIDSALLNSKFGLKIRLHKADSIRKIRSPSEAEAELEIIVKLMTETLGKQSDNTMLGRVMLLRANFDLKRPGRTGLADELVADQTAVNGPNYHGTLTAQFWQAMVYDMDGRPQEALAILERILPLKIKIKGERHGDTLQTKAYIDKLKELRSS